MLILEFQSMLMLTIEKLVCAMPSAFGRDVFISLAVTSEREHFELGLRAFPFFSEK